MPENPLFFLHFPRTAGTTIDDIFFRNYSPDKIIKIYSRQEYEKYRTIDAKQLEGIAFITGHLLLSRTNPTQFYNRDVRAFTFLRDPVKRIYSEYLFLKTWDQQHLYHYLNDKDITFSQYISSEDKLLRYRGKNFMTRCISGDNLEDGHIEESLEKAKNNLKNSFFFCGIQERFLESLLLLAEKTGIKDILHQKRNSLKYNAVADKMTEAEEEIVREYNWADIELYRYAQQLLNERIHEGGEAFQRRLKEFKFLNTKYQKMADLLQQSYEKGANEGKIVLPKDAIW